MSVGLLVGEKSLCLGCRGLADLLVVGHLRESELRVVKVVKIAFLMELEGLNGRDKLKGYAVDSVIKYPGK